MNPHTKALDSMLGDMDGMESKKMFGEPEQENKGVSITISVSPQGEISQGDVVPSSEEEGMSKGGMVEETDTALPPFLRKKKKGMSV